VFDTLPARKDVSHDGQQVIAGLGFRDREWRVTG
jgi:hypothetical protein